MFHHHRRLVSHSLPDEPQRATYLTRSRARGCRVVRNRLRQECQAHQQIMQMQWSGRAVHKQRVTTTRAEVVMWLQTSHGSVQNESEIRKNDLPAPMNDPRYCTTTKRALEHQERMGRSSCEDGPARDDTECQKEMRTQGTVLRSCKTRQNTSVNAWSKELNKTQLRELKRSPVISETKRAHPRKPCRSNDVNERTREVGIPSGPGGYISEPECREASRAIGRVTAMKMTNIPRWNGWRNEQRALRPETSRNMVASWRQGVSAPMVQPHDGQRT
ncbi:hypothetical protein HD554DRAFT_2068862 [Boletus coccyginus]|nr:hypothetical protein HD554DRAFT_2068862 [Boletus coccyginus]